MSEGDWLAGQFEQNRPRLRAVAYRMLGSAAEADDAVQEAWLRLSHSGALAGRTHPSAEETSIRMLRHDRRGGLFPGMSPGRIGDKASAPTGCGAYGTGRYGRPNQSDKPCHSPRRVGVRRRGHRPVGLAIAHVL
jgi:hypothetical protein